jgi:hypothetical protein
MTRRWSRSILLFILALGLLLAVLQLNGHLVPAGDNATYVVLGQSLATGDGYRMISDPRRPSMALYPPAYPMVLAAVLLLTGTARNLLAAIVPMKLLSITLYLLGLVLIYEVFRRRNPVLAAMATLLSAVNPHLLYYANEVGTEILYLVLSLASIWLFQRYHEKRDTKLLLLTILTLAFSSYVRSVALVMLVAFGLYCLVRRQFRTAVLLVLAVGALAAPWLVYSSSLPNTGTSVGLGRGYFALYFSSDPYGTARASLSDWIARIVQNSRIYALDIWPEVLFPHALSVARMLGPIVVYYFLSAIEFLLTPRVHLLRQIRTSVQFLAVGCLALSALWADVRDIQRNLRYGLGQPVETYYSTDVGWSNYLKAMRWIAKTAPQDAAVMCRKADLLYILTQHPALEYPYSADGAELSQAVYNNKVTYVIEDAFTWTGTTQQYLRPALQDWQNQDPSALALAYETTKPATRVWRVRQP